MASTKSKSTVTSIATLWQSSVARPQCRIRPSAFRPVQQLRNASQSSQGRGKKKTEPKKKARANYVLGDLSKAEQFSLCDAMRYIRAFEVGQSPTSRKYELQVKLRTPKNAPVVRNRMRLPHPVKTDVRICVICPPNSKHAEKARKAGAVLVGEDEIFEAVKAGRIEFDRCLCHTDSLPKLSKAGVARILGPRGLMPSAKLGTVVKDVDSSVKNMIGGAEYREKMGVVRLPIGQLGFSPEELQKNIRAFIDAMRKDMAQLSDRVSKDIHEVVLKSTNSAGFSLSGEFRTPGSVTARELSTL